MALDGHQKRTFLPYLRGIPPEDLRLGSLYINPLEPTDGLASLRWEFMGDENQTVYENAVSKWTRSRPEIDRPFAIEFEASKARSLGGGFTEFLSFNATKTKDSLVSIQGQSGRRVKIKNPEAFLEEVMKQPGVNEWVRQHASIVRKGKHGINAWKAPKIWMVTAVQHVTGGDIHAEGSTSNRFGGAVGVDPSLAANAPPGTLKLKTEANFENSNGASTNFGHDDERVWAAQFMPVFIEFDYEQDAELSAKKGSDLPKTIKQIQLQEIEDLALRGIRSPIKRDNDALGGLVPGLTGRVTLQDTGSESIKIEETSSTEEADDMVVDDAQYVANKTESDWERYNACKKWLRDVPRN